MKEEKQHFLLLLHPSPLFAASLQELDCNHFTTVFVHGKWTKYLDAHKQSRIIERVICGSWLRVFGLVSA